MQDGTPTNKASAATTTTEIKPMKFILSFLIATTILSADTCFKLALGNAALTPTVLCNPISIVTPVTPVKCITPTLTLPTTPVIKCDLPTITPAPAPIVSKCTPVPIVCPTPVPPPVIEGTKVPTTPDCHPTPTSATPEPSSYALLGAGLMTAGIAHKFRKN